MLHMLLAAYLLQSAAGPANAAAFSRVDRMAEYVAVAPWCEKIGYTLAPDFADRLAEIAYREADATSVPHSTVDVWIHDALARHQRLAQSEYQRVLDAMDTPETTRVALNGLLDKVQRVCSDAGADPAFGPLLTTPSSNEMVEARREMADGLLESSGQASWQTPTMFAKAELMMALGVCKSQITAARHDALYARFITESPPSSQEQRYYAQQYLDGIESGPDLALDSTQCSRLLASRLAAAR